jgi:hypothetical protein
MKIKKTRPKLFDIFMPYVETAQPIPVINTEKKKRAKKTVQEDSVIKTGGDTTRVVNANGDTTLITITKKTQSHIDGFVVKIHRTYLEGGEYEEPDHFWPNYKEAETDAKDWTYLAKKTDW